MRGSFASMIVEQKMTGVICADRLGKIMVPTSFTIMKRLWAMAIMTASSFVPVKTATIAISSALWCPSCSATKKSRPFILHLSTVSAGFAQAAYDFLSAEGIDYVNYPLTGGPLGAENANMLILASGSESIYSRLEPTLQTIGNPKYFGSSITAGAEVKLMGQLMVFNGLLGICSAAALKSECFQEELSGSEQAEFFDFLNGGAGGTRQWDVAISKGVRDNTWDQGFMTQHAVVDAIYAAKLCRERGLPALAVIPMVAIALAFAYLLKKYEGTPLATHAIVREMIQKNASGLDDFTTQHINYTDVDASIQNSIAVLPQRVKDSVMLDINKDSFSEDRPKEKPAEAD